MRSIIAAAMLVMLVPAGSAHAQAVSIRNPANFWSTLKAMGYAPTPIANADKTPEFDITIDGFATTLRLQGCTAGRDCQYMTLVASFSDVMNAPSNWLQQMNDEFDLLRVGTNGKGQLYMFGGYVIEGLPRSELKRIFDYWAADTSAIGQEAIDGGYTTKK